MSLKKRQVRLKDLPIGSVVFAPEDLFVLMGGFDPAMFACNPFTMDVEALAGRRPDREEWRRQMVGRYRPGGLVDEEGNPCPALADALAPLRSCELFVADGPERTEALFEPRTVELAFSGGRATALVSERSVIRGKIQGFRLVPLGHDRARWNSWLAEHVEGPEKLGDAAISLSATQLTDSNGVAVEQTGGNIRDAFDRGDIEAARAWATSVGADADAVGEAARVLGHVLVRPRRFVVEDFRGCTFKKLNGIDLPSRPEGPYRFRLASLYTAAGIDVSACEAQRPGYPDTWAQDEKLLGESTFIHVSFYRHKALIDALTETYPHPAGAPGPQTIENR